MKLGRIAHSSPVSREEYDRAVPALRAGLLKAQRDLQAARIPLILIVSGADGAGKSEMVNRLHEWVDPRGVETHVFGKPTREEKEFPDYRRFWMALPARGRVGVFLGSWYTDPILRRVYRKSGKTEFERSIERIRSFEEELALDGALIVKIWLHLEKKTQKKRLRRFEANPLTRWRVSPLDWEHFRRYNRFVVLSDRAIERTDAPHARWHAIDAADDRRRELLVGRTILDAIRKRLASDAPRRSTRKPVRLKSIRGSALSRVKLDRTANPETYDEQLALLQGRINRLSRAAWEKKISTVLAFEGWDAAGKGGTIRRLTAAMDARLYRVVPIAAPTDEERAHQYLWRFWRHVPMPGRVTIFDRSWYGRVLVERVEGFAREDEWKRAYAEINDFEGQLADHGISVTKFWVHLSKEEQLRRFQERQETEFKKYKITEEDWRNRKQWDAYETAVDEMLGRTHTPQAPWVVVAGNDKRWARLRILESVCERLERAVG